MKPLRPFIEDEAAFIRDAQDETRRAKLIADFTRLRAWMLWCAIAAIVMVFASVAFSAAIGHSLLLGPLLGFTYFWMKFSECNTTLRMLRLFASLMERTSPDR